MTKRLSPWANASRGEGTKFTGRRFSEDPGLRDGCRCRKEPLRLWLGLLLLHGFFQWLLHRFRLLPTPHLPHLDLSTAPMGGSAATTSVARYNEFKLAAPVA